MGGDYLVEFVASYLSALTDAICGWMNAIKKKFTATGVLHKRKKTPAKTLNPFKIATLINDNNNSRAGIITVADHYARQDSYGDWVRF